MGGGSSLGKSESGSSNSSGFTQDVFEPQANALSGAYGTAGNLANQSFGKGGKSAGNQMDAGRDYSQNVMGSVTDPWKQQMAGGAYSNLGIGDQLMSSLQQSQNNPSAMQDINSMIMGGSGNNYADAMRGQFTEDATQAQNNMLKNMDARAAASGMSGGSRHGTAIGQGMQDINRNLQRNMADVGYNTFDKDLDRKLSIAQQADQGNLARQQMMQQMLSGQQGSMDTGITNAGNMLNYGTQQQMMPWQQMGAYSNIIGGPTVLSSGSGSGSSSSKGLGGSVGGK